VEVGGLIIGRGGNTIRSISEESRAVIQLGSRDSEETKISKERVLVMSGSLESCIKCTELIILKLQEDPLFSYQNKSTSYNRSIKNSQGSGRDNVPAAFGLPMSLPLGAETLSASTTITLSVPDQLVGYILGKRGVTIAEIQSMSGAKVVISPRYLHFNYIRKILC
jgi:predicted RNA-binding protein YlqC (UPF0109 family)